MPRPLPARALLACLTLLMAPAAVQGQQRQPPCKPHRLAPKPAKAAMESCRALLFDGAVFIVGAPDAGQKSRVTREGALHESAFRHPKATADEVIAARRSALEKQGFEAVHDVADSDFGRILTMRRTSPRETWIEVRAETFNEGEFSESTVRVLEVKPLPRRLQSPRAKAPRGVEDAKGCRDLKHVGRMPGAQIERCSTQSDQPAPPVLQRLADAGTIRGDVEIVTYVESPETSPLEVARSYEAALDARGFELLDQLQSEAQQVLLMHKPDAAPAVYLLVIAEGVNDGAFVRTTVSTFLPRRE